MNKVAGAGIGVVIVLIAITAFYMMNQSDETTTQVGLDENVEMTAEESETESYQVELDEGLKIGGNP